MIGQLLENRYQVIRALGKGAFGQTYLAQDTQYPGKPHCVVKHLQPDDPRNLEKAKQLFLREAEILAKLGKHDQIPELKAYSEQEFYLVQEFIDGHPLRDEIPPSSHYWTEYQVISLLQDILPILVFIHDEGVIHRDIKPDNIMRRRRDNKLILIDFGAIKKALNTPAKGGSTVVGSVIYTLGYAPPEQTSGKPQFSSDIYALGMNAIETLTGVSPHLLPEDDNTGEIIWRKDTGEIAGKNDAGKIIWQNKTSVSPGLAVILTKMIRYRRQDRYQSAGEVLQALQQLIQASQAQATSSSGLVNQLTLEWQEAGQVRNTTIREQQPSKNPGTIRIGRDPAQCDIVFSDLTVSGLHVEIFFNQQQQQFYLRNLRSSNPPIIDGRPLPVGEVTLSQGSNIQLGQMNLRVANISLGQTSLVVPTQLATTTKPTEVATSYQSSAPTPVALTKNPAGEINNDVDENIKRGKQLIEQKDYQAAIHIFDMVLQLSPNDAEVYYWRGRTYFKLKEYTKAIEDFNNALQWNPNYAEAYCWRGDAHCELGEYQEALQDANTALQFNFKLAEAYAVRSGAHFGLGGNETAMKDINTALQYKPDYAEAYLLRGAINCKLEKYQAGVKDFSSALLHNPDCAEAYYVRALAYASLEEINAVINDINLAIKLNPDFAEAYDLRGNVNCVQGNYAAAIRDFNSAGRIENKLENKVLVRQTKNWKSTHTLKAHSTSLGVGGVRDVTFSVDGKTLISGGFLNELKVWKLTQKKEAIKVYGHSGDVRAVTFTPDGNYFISSSEDKTIKIWDFQTRLEIATLAGHTKAVTALAVEPSGQILVSGSDDKTIRLWDLESTEEIIAIDAHSSYVQSIAFSPDGNTFASGACDNTIKVWNLAQILTSAASPENFEALYVTLSGHSSYVYSVAFSPNGRLLASGDFDGKILLWNLGTQEIIHTFSGHTSGASYSVAVAFSPDWYTLVSGGPDNTIKIWDIETGKLKSTLTGHSKAVASIVFSSNGNNFASGSVDGTIMLWQS
jgi:WD40 repeat protein/serine/threonine protein kinase